jgi:hypothetical protein
VGGIVRRSEGQFRVSVEIGEPCEVLLDRNVEVDPAEQIRVFSMGFGFE